MDTSAFSFFHVPGCGDDLPGVSESADLMESGFLSAASAEGHLTDFLRVVLVV